MDSKKLGLLVVTIAIVAGLALYFLFINPPGPVNVTAKELLADPNRFNDRDVKIEGSLRKVWFENKLLHSISDGGAEIAIIASADIDLDAYVGLRVMAEGKFRNRPQASSAPRMFVEASSVRGKNTTPSFFLQWERSGGIAGFQDIFIIDNNSTALLMSRGKVSLEKLLSQSQQQKVTKIITDNNFFTIPTNPYVARDGVADYFGYSLKVVLVSGAKLESRTVRWVDEWAAKGPLPSDLVRVERDLKGFITSLLPPPTGGTLIEVSADKSKIVVGEYVSLKLKITNVGSGDRTYDISPPAFDMILLDVNGTLIAKWSQGQFFPAVVLSKTLAPGGSYEEEFFWNLYRYDDTSAFKPTRPGTYYLEGVFRSIPDLKASRLRFEIAPRM